MVSKLSNIQWIKCQNYEHYEKLANSRQKYGKVMSEKVVYLALHIKLHIKRTKAKFIFKNVSNGPAFS